MRRLVATGCALALLLAGSALSACGGEEAATEAGPAGDERVESAAGDGDTDRRGDPANEDAEADPDVASVSGRAVYAANCAVCHGETGVGEGPASIGLEPPPADFTDGQWVTGDGSLGAIRNTIQNGSPGTAMIAWEGTLTEAEITAVAQHVVSLSQGGGAE